MKRRTNLVNSWKEKRKETRSEIYQSFKYQGRDGLHKRYVERNQVVVVLYKFVYNGFLEVVLFIRFRISVKVRIRKKRTELKHLLGYTVQSKTKVNNRFFVTPNLPYVVFL